MYWVKSKHKINKKSNDLLMVIIAVLALIWITSCNERIESKTNLLNYNDYKHYIDAFNKNDDELYIQFYSNDAAWEFLKVNIPLVELPDKTIEETYYFRWWTFRKHIKRTPEGFIITEFLPDVPWAGKYNAIACPAGHQIYEGRWLANQIYLNDYINYWLTVAGDDIRRYSFWAANSVFEFYKVNPNPENLNAWYPGLVKNYTAWENSRRDPDETLFWTVDGWDGMEVSAGGRLIKESTGSLESLRPTLNSYMYGDAMALSAMAALLEKDRQSAMFFKKAQHIKSSMENQLWNEELNFFTALPRNYSTEDSPVAVRENIGLVPWYFNLPDDSDQFSNAWQQVIDTAGFAAPKGLTVCEQRHKYFDISYEGHECQWNGPSWPFATTQTLKGLSNLLINYEHQAGLNKRNFYELLLQYAEAHQIINDNGVRQNWIDENLNPFTGDWIARTRLKTWENGSWSMAKGGVERGKDYNHSGFCDLVISDLIGVKPLVADILEVRPLIPNDWDWFALDKIKYHDRTITIIWDKTGKKFELGKGFLILVDGEVKHHSAKIVDVIIEI